MRPSGFPYHIGERALLSNTQRLHVSKCHERRVVSVRSSRAPNLVLTRLDAGTRALNGFLGGRTALRKPLGSVRNKLLGGRG